ncbi:DNA (cytosine-5-)-methyltransferase [Larkinella soli]|uniref:DNA (cytosine-5-)-methyltransferase n=1 Tax=Larkinella soli TaxID=1770527 RepID=UPI000FFC3FAD|nr:DNA (cytosine-5-)-methyltransferase [Larkinella soli]
MNVASPAILTYTAIRKALGIDNPKNKFKPGLDSLTHYIQNLGTPAADYFREAALQYLDANRLTDLSEAVFEGEVFFDVPFPPTERPKFTFIDLFAGIGGIRMAYQSLGGKCVFTSEWSPMAQRTYEANYGEVPFGDITKVHTDQIPDHDVLLAGFPCQPFSIAGVSKKNSLGRQHGFKDETQGTLFFDIVRILEAKKPSAFMLENVKNLVSHDKGNTFRVIKGALHELGYTVYHKVLDGKHFVPQHRERIIIVGFREDRFGFLNFFDFPDLPTPTAVMEDILEPDAHDRYTLTPNLWEYLQNYAVKHKEKGNGFGFGLIRPDGISRTLSARYYKDGSEVLIPQEGGKNPRRLTPRECARLQGFPDNFIIPVSDTQAYKQFGNSVVMPLMRAVGAKVVDVITRYESQ